MRSEIDMSRVFRGDSISLSRALSHVVRQSDEGGRVVEAAREHERRARRVVVTGPPGVGKSTLLRSIFATLRARGERVAVVALDPSSLRTGGAFLGDRVRWSDFAEDEGVFIRSVAQRGDHAVTQDIVDGMADVFDAAGWPWIVLETVGAGQNPEPGLRGATTVLVLSPLCGDEMQMLKAGVIESADVYAVNRVDLPGGERWAASLEETLALGRVEPPVVLRVAAATGAGVERLVEEIEKTGDER
jgi:LAO/AO transport system kinase